MKIKGDYLLDTIGGEKMAVPITVNDGGLAGLNSESIENFIM